MLYIQILFLLLFAWWSLCICEDTWILWYQGRSSYIHRPEWETLVHDQKGKHWHHLTRNDRLQLEGSRSWEFRPEITPNIGQCEGCPNCWFLHCYLQVFSYTSFSNLQLGAGASFWRRLATHEVLTKLLWRGFFYIRLQWTQGGRRFPQVRGIRMMIYPQWESKARWIEPIKKRQKKKSKMGIEKVILNGP
jgi:hypothetical protein